MTFGEYIKQRRILLGMSLRTFCINNGCDASNWSKIERGIAKPPADDGRLAELATLLGIDEDSPAWHEFFDLAAIGRSALPSSIMRDADLVSRLPAFLCIMRAKKITEKQMNSLIELIRQNR